MEEEVGKGEERNLKSVRSGTGPSLLGVGIDIASFMLIDLEF